MVITVQQPSIVEEKKSENTAKDYLLSYLISENNVKIYAVQPIGKI
jgi:hypothetical protein